MAHPEPPVVVYLGDWSSSAEGRITSHCAPKLSQIINLIIKRQSMSEVGRFKHSYKMAIEQPSAWLLLRNEEHNRAQACSMQSAIVLCVTPSAFLIKVTHTDRQTDR
jgi:hypothetical protein